MKTLCTFLLAIAVTSTAAADEPLNPSIGVSYFSIANISAESKAEGKYPANGAYLDTVEPYSSFARAGAKAGDIVFAANDKAIKTKEDLDAALEAVKVGDRMRLKVHRDANGKSWKQAGFTVTFVGLVDAIRDAVDDQRDKVKPWRVLRHKDAPKFVNVRSNVQIVIIVPDDGEPEMSLRLNNFSRGSFFASSFSLRAGTRSFEIDPMGDVHRDYNSGGCWSWYDLPLDSEERLGIAAAIALSDETIVRFEGRDSYKDYELKPEERGMIRTMLDRYKLLAAERR